jgi:hypothetical protein
MDTAKIVTMLEELTLNVVAIKETLAKQNNDLLTKRLDSLDAAIKDQHLKLDTLNAVDLGSVAVTPQVKPKKTATAAKKDNIELDVEAVAEPAVEPTTFTNVVEYFRHMWVYKRDVLYAKNVLSQAEYEKVYKENKDKIEKNKKNKNDITLQRSIAYQIWKTLKKDSKDIVVAMKNQNSNDIQKNNSHEIDEEIDD